MFVHCYGGGIFSFLLGAQLRDYTCMYYICMPLITDARTHLRMLVGSTSNTCIYVIRTHSRYTCPQTVSVHIPVLIHLPLHISTLTHVNVYTYPNEYMPTLVYSHTNSCQHLHRPTLKHAHTHTCPHLHMPKLLHAHACIYANTNTRPRLHMPTITDNCIYARAN